jgi:hypothetical protein
VIGSWQMPAQADAPAPAAKKKRYELKLFTGNSNPKLANGKQWQ